MGRHKSFGFGYDDDVFWDEAVRLYPKMNESRLFHMIVRQWLDFKKKTPKVMSLEEAIKVLEEYIKTIKITQKAVGKLNEF
jgi:hypothetical protein